MVVKIDEEKCDGCKSCEEVRPVDAINVNDKAHVDEEECIECSVCIDECPNDAISMEG